MRTENLTVVMLIGLPLVAAVCLGLLAQAFVYGGGHWLLWLTVLGVSCVVWAYYLGMVS